MPSKVKAAPASCGASRPQPNQTQFAANTGSNALATPTSKTVCPNAGGAAAFVRWYNHDHRRSGIRYVSPAQRHAGQDHAILAARHALYLQARESTPARWSGKTRNWEPTGAVTLNPERGCVIKAHLQEVIQPMAV